MIVFKLINFTVFCKYAHPFLNLWQYGSVLVSVAWVTCTSVQVQCIQVFQHMLPSMLFRDVPYPSEPMPRNVTAAGLHNKRGPILDYPASVQTCLYIKIFEEWKMFWSTRGPDSTFMECIAHIKSRKTVVSDKQVYQFEHETWSYSVSNLI